MTLVDWTAIIILGASVLGGLFQGFFRSFCSFAGLVLGLVVAAWNYQRLAGVLISLVRMQAVANTIAFLLIAFVVMALLALIGNLLARAFKLLGLGCLDALAGAIFGLFQGIVTVVLAILVVVAFFPEVHWIADSRVPRMFFGACHLSANVTPDELAEKVRTGLRNWETQSPEWMHPEHSR